MNAFKVATSEGPAIANVTHRKHFKTAAQRKHADDAMRSLGLGATEQALDRQKSKRALLDAKKRKKIKRMERMNSVKSLFTAPLAGKKKEKKKKNKFVDHELTAMEVIKDAEEAREREKEQKVARMNRSVKEHEEIMKLKHVKELKDARKLLADERQLLEKKNNPQQGELGEQGTTQLPSDQTQLEAKDQSSSPAAKEENKAATSKGGVKGGVKGGAKGCAKGGAKSSTKSSTKSSVQSSVTVGAKDSVKSSVKVVAKKPVGAQDNANTKTSDKNDTNIAAKLEQDTAAKLKQDKAAAQQVNEAKANEKKKHQELMKRRQVLMEQETNLRQTFTAIKNPQQFESIQQALKTLTANPLCAANGAQKTVIAEATALLKQMENMHLLKVAIAALNQKVIAEIRSFNQPKPEIVDCMRCCFLLLGTPSQDVQEWKQLQGLIGKMGKLGLKRRINLFTIANGRELAPQVLQEARSLNAKVDVARVLDVSSGAATFFAWCKGVLDEL
jgi:hypothetical protein